MTLSSSVLPRAAPSVSIGSIAAVVAADGISGLGRQLTALIRALRGAGIACRVIVFHRRGRPPAAFAGYLADAGVEHCVVEDRGPLDWGLVTRVQRVLERWRPAILQTHGYKATAVAYALPRSLRPPLPWIGFFHGSTTEDLKARFYHWLDRQLLGSAERIVVMSEAQGRAFRRYGRRVRVIYNAALGPTPTGGASERDRLTAHAARLPRPIIGVVGRLSPEKGVDLFLDACAVLARKGVAFSALVAGDGPERSRLEACCRALALESQVHFLGQVSDVEGVYRHLDLLVLPSRSEGLPNTLLEALCADVPVVATAVGAVPEVVGTSSAARLVAPHSAAALAEVVERAVTQGDSPEAGAARREVVNRFSVQRRLEAHLQLYREVLEERYHRAS